MKFLKLTLTESGVAQFVNPKSIVAFRSGLKESEGRIAAQEGTFMVLGVNEGWKESDVAESRAMQLWVRETPDEIYELLEAL